MPSYLRLDKLNYVVRQALTWACFSRDMREDAVRVVCAGKIYSFCQGGY
jgi:hypothetical protein